MELFQASREWASRPADERYVSLKDMLASASAHRASSRQMVVANRKIIVVPQADNQGLALRGPNDGQAFPTHWAFGQLCTLSETPAGFMRTIPSPFVADIINWKLQTVRQVAEIGVLLYKNGQVSARALTGPNYGRVWNSEVISTVIDRFGDGVAGNGSPWQVPGEFGKRVQVDQGNTTLFCGESDMFIFLVDEENKIEIPGRGPMARGFFVWNSEVGKCVLGIATFYFDYVCCNRIVWGASQYKQIKIRHTSGAPVRWEDEVMPALRAYRADSSKTIVQAIAAAQKSRLDSDDVAKLITERFGKRMAPAFEDVHMDEESRPIESIWDVVTAATAFAKRIKWQDERVEVERKAGDLLEMTRRAA